jgi:hypothetical protein
MKRWKGINPPGTHHISAEFTQAGGHASPFEIYKY